MRRYVRRLVLQRMVVVVIGAMALAVMCASTDPRLLAGAHDFKVLPTASIVDSPDTVGLADSNLLRLQTHADIDKELDMMQSIGIQDIRVGLYWAEIEPAQGVYNWSNADYIIDQANKRGMGVLATLNETPAWAGPVGSGTPSTTDYAAYAQTVAERYKGKISAMEVWNEPNANFFLNPVSPSNYTALLKAAYAAIKSVDSSITVIGGVLGSGRTLGNATMNPVTFLQGMYEAGAQGYFDALSFHPYDYTLMFSQQQDQVASPLRQLENMRLLMEAYGDGAKKIWASEYGLPTATSSDGVSQQQQADYLKDFLNSWGQQAGTGPIFVYSTRDLNTGDGQDADNFGIWQTDWTAKPAVQVIQDFIAAHTAAPTNPIINAIKTIIVDGVKLVGAVITGVVNLVVGVVDAIAAAVVWAVKTVAKVVVNVVNGIGNLVKNVVNAVVSGVEHCLGVGAAATATAAAAKTKVAAVSAAKPAAAVKSAVAVQKSTKVKKSGVDASGAKPAADSAEGKGAADGPSDTKAKDSGRKPSVGKAGKTGNGRGQASGVSPSPTATDSGATDSGKPAHAGAPKKMNDVSTGPRHVRSGAASVG
ncbi:hypothetical protein ABIA30_003797 [Mycobacterium sp. MAA66]|uniref:cellulase family glycosylhydrolase n=1 Tax=Mycobacterium sp. MAA66 TaxID=3156297 RepID=UPI003518D78C